MTDGPFRNAELNRRWKRYGRSLISNAASVEERAMQACHSMLADIDLCGFSALFSELKAHIEHPQMNLAPIAAVESIFERHPPSPMSDAFQRHLFANLRDQRFSENALENSLESTTKEWIATTKNRLHEECVRALELGNMSREEYRNGIERNRETFIAIKSGELSGAVATGNKHAFALSVQKKTGSDVGPEE